MLFAGNPIQSVKNIIQKADAAPVIIICPIIIQ
jgi:hypothetical protein